MLILPIKKKWFDMIASGEKKEEYREIKPYWSKRFGNILLGYSLESVKIELYKNIKFSIIFRNGYKKDSPQIKCKCKLKVGQGKEEWGAEPGKEYYVLEILEVLE